MTGDQFVLERQKDWQRLAAYSDRLGGSGIRSMTGADITQFVQLYRRTTADLARARTLEVRTEVLDYLNQLVGRIHFQIYQTQSFPLIGVWRYLSAGFPQAIRRNARWVLIAVALLLVPGVTAFIAVQANPVLARVFVPPEFYENVGHYDETGRSAGQVALMTSFYIFNNVKVSFLAFAFGMLLGFGSAYILVSNGAILGAMTAIIAQHDHSYPFWSFVASHGAIEMTAIVLAGAAGMLVGSKILNPGPYTRRRALIEAGREAGQIIYGVIIMLCIAAVIEASISPSTLPNPVKIALGVCNLALVILYFTLAGRGATRVVSP